MTTTSEGKATESISSQFGLHQVINEPTDILIFITRSFSQNLTLKFFSHHLISATPCTTMMQILIFSDEQLICLIGTELSHTPMLMKSCKQNYFEYTF